MTISKSIIGINRNKPLEPPLPPEEHIAALCKMLSNRWKKEETHRRYAPVKQVLTIIGVAGAIGLSFVSPTAVMLAKPLLDEKKRSDREAWRAYNPSFLRRTIKRLQSQKLVEMTKDDGKQVVILTKAGRRRILKYSLDGLSIEKPIHWDGCWRMVIYDVEDRRKQLRDLFRSTLRGLGFYKLQESVWLYPYPCEEQVTFLREYYGVGNEVLYVIATKLEDDAPYRTYFKLG